MRNHRIENLGAITALLLLAAFALVVGKWREPDPIYEGKRLSQYLTGITGCGFVSGGGIDGVGRLEEPVEPRVDISPFNGPAMEAISKVGTNGLPMLVHMLRGGESRLESWLRKGIQKFPALGKIFQLKPSNRWPNQAGAVVAFSRLGPRAASAIPNIIPLLNDPDSASGALLALKYIQPERESDILKLTNVFRLQTKRASGAPIYILRSDALLVIGGFGPKASKATPFLIGCLNSTNETIRGAAAVALARIGAASETAIPMMVANLPKTNPPRYNPMQPGQFNSAARIAAHIAHSADMMTIWALGQYGHHAHSVLPILSNLEYYPSRNIQQAANEAAAKIRGATNSVVK